MNDVIREDPEESSNSQNPQLFTQMAALNF